MNSAFKVTVVILLWMIGFVFMLYGNSINLIASIWGQLGMCILTLAINLAFIRTDR